MKLLILSVLSLSLMSLVSCNRDFKNVRKGLGSKKEPVGNFTFIKNEIKGGVGFNLQKVNKVSIESFMTGGQSKKTRPICRGVDGCLHVCEYFKHKKCKQFSVDEVLTFWLGKINSYTEWPQAEKDLNLIATDSEVSDFLKYVDQNNQVAQALFNLNTSADCSMGDINILYSYSPEPALYVSPKDDDALAPVMIEKAVDTAQEPAQPLNLSLAGASSNNVAEDLVKLDAISMEELPESVEEKELPGSSVEVADEDSLTDGTEEVLDADALLNSDVAGITEAENLALNEDSDQEIIYEVQENKKIVEGKKLIQFSFPIFRGFIKKCFGHKTRSFSEMALEIENYSAFEIGHDVIAKACGGNSECVRLAYCAIDSDRVWDNLEDDVKSAGCEYKNFTEMM